MGIVLDQQVVEGDDERLRAALAGADLPVDDLSDAGRRFFLFSSGGETVGFGGLEMYGHAAFLRSIVVLSDRRGFGYGHAITLGLLGQARAQAADTAYLLTQTAAPFFQALGFRPIARNEAPVEIRTTRQAASLCPASAMLMVRSLSA